ncbi:glycolipid 2-alpha-mannosyltransferase-domain-containing protein [Circinella umbellata]|nr:glycolipid 2-alpha-mannosyltransferase-domain-containing protein [Circinella umbellata]
MAQEEFEVIINPEEKVFIDKSTNDKNPVFVKSKNQDNDGETTLVVTYPTDENINSTTLTTPTITQPQEADRANAAIVILCRNSELPAMRRTIREFEDRFNRKYHYPYVFLNDEPFTDTFIKSIRQLTDAPTEFGLVPDTMWSVPDWVDEKQVEEALADYASRNILYGGSLSYRHMCRFNSGFFYNHPLVAKYDYYWRVEPGVHFFCDLDYDPFVYMQKNNKLYSFTITLVEIPQTIPTLWDHTMRFAHQNNIETNFLRMFGDEENGYNYCHFWSNFEIASLDLWRDEKYQAYFDYLDSTGNFFYERWGDAIVHSLAAGMFLNKSQVHFFKDIGYQHDSFAHCVDDGVFGKCMCPENVANFDYNGWGTCMPKWDAFPEEGIRWDFKSNGDQIIGKEAKIISKPEYVSKSSKKSSFSNKKAFSSSSSSS